MADLKRVNGNQISWGSVVVKIDGDRYYGFSSLEYGEKRERTYHWGMGKHHAPRGRSRGKYTPEPVKLKGPKASVMALLEALAKKSSTGTSYGDAECEIVAQYIETSETPITVQIEQCVWVATRESHSESAEVLEDEIEFSCMRVRKNNLVGFDESTQGN